MYNCCRWTLVATLFLFCVFAGSRPARANPNTIGDVLHPTKPSVSDPETSVEIMYPLNGSMEKPPVTFTTQIHVRPGQTEKFTDLYNGKYLCIETRGRELVANVTRSCSRIGGTEVVIQHNQLGDFSSRAYIARTTAPDDVRYWQSSDVMFSVVHEADLAALIARRIEEQGQFYPDYDLGIVEWAAQQQRLQDTELVRRLGEDQPVFGGLSSAARSKKYEGDEEDLMLVVGIKTALVTGFAFRQAIRQTWASKEALPSGVKVFFIGCRPTTNKGVGNYSADAVGDNVSDFRRLWGAIQLEKLVYGDVLTDELDCADSNAFLAKKVKEFLHFTATRYAHAQYVMIADDNLYVRMDTVVHQLRAKASRLRFYGGDFQTKGNNTVLTTAQYPMGELPPFAIGAYFFLSMDCVQFISKNRQRLRSLDGMDDLSVALWLLTIHVGAQHFGGLKQLRRGPCTDNALALGDMSPLSIRLVHDNILDGRSMCHGFNHHLWFKPPAVSAPQMNSYRLPGFPESLQFDFYLRDPMAIRNLELVSIISTHSLSGIKVSYFPILETFSNYARWICGFARLNFAGAVGTRSCDEISRQARVELQSYSERLREAGTIDPCRIEVWKYNIFVADPAALPLIVAYAPHASFSRLVLESLFASVFQEKKRPVLVMPENILRSHYGVSPDVFVFSVLGVRCNPVSTPECQEMVAEYFHRYGASSSTNQEPHTTHFVMLSGEAWSAEGLDERVLLLSTVANVNRAKHVYLSMASLSFGERLDHGPMSLLSASGKFEAKTKFCAYLYAHCEHRDRETMFDELNALRPVDALGICAGSSRPPDHARIASRETMFYNDDAIRRYAPYKFVIAFENSPVAGYVTEKLVNAFLAGSIPIYMGDSATVSGLFNPKSFIDCGQFESLRDCAMYVVQVDDSLEIYTRMLREPPVTNLTAFNDAFSWHPTVPSRATADAVLKHLTNEEKG
ncbi:hypothetical protein PF002_g4407 [Phytophthora fragariae]|uniref:Fucosyltransferase n=1 Tax=Phytophthora fragariae TaxID=53985 RepID=A0A6A4A423_9STRA|nr:hypothetical protein PF002_g4407 [Phytophthora fragariae]